MHPRRLDRAHQLDGTRQFAFERPDARDFLHERGEAERAQLIEELVAGVGIVGQALFGKQHARLRRLAKVNEHRTPIGAQVEIDVGFFERRGDPAHVLPVKPAVEQFERRPAQIIARQSRDHENHEAGHAEPNKPPRSKPRKIRPDTLCLFERRHRYPRPKHFCNVRRQACLEIARVEQTRLRPFRA